MEIPCACDLAAKALSDVLCWSGLATEDDPEVPEGAVLLTTLTDADFTGEIVELLTISLPLFGTALLPPDWFTLGGGNFVDVVPNPCSEA